MATIKYNEDENGNKRIILKNGKVSCTCCEEPECCMYPAQAFADGLYRVEDLPDELIMYAYNSVQLFGPTIVSRNQNGTYGESNQGAGPFIQQGGGEWTTTYVQLDPSDACLIKSRIQDDPPIPTPPNSGRVWVFDRFADTYTLSWSAFGLGSISATVERESLCVWSGTDPCGVPIYLFYGDNEAIPQGGDALGWNVRINVYVGSCSSPDGGESIQKRNDPSARQNTPIGVYLASTTTNVTVS
jgi:hypothetical protein